ncbi:hypothetical protein R1flu_013503 [Riccia fluitans]|uniref:Uncharacterized protein n=1 Tax=Riccia fluitans TaxID=41844 RepID=A0ABD1YDK1_9MARC
MEKKKKEILECRYQDLRKATKDWFSDCKRRSRNITGVWANTIPAFEVLIVVPEAFQSFSYLILNKAVQVFTMRKIPEAVLDEESNYINPSVFPLLQPLWKISKVWICTMSPSFGCGWPEKCQGQGFDDDEDKIMPTPTVKIHK